MGKLLKKNVKINMSQHKILYEDIYILNFIKVILLNLYNIKLYTK